MQLPRSLSLTTLALTLLALTAVHAAEFRVLGLKQLEGLDTLEFVSADGVQQVPVSTAYFSNSYKVPASGVVAFYDKAPARDEQKAPLFTVRFPENAGDMIVLLDAEAAAHTYRYGLIDDSVRSFPSGSVYIMNFMHKPVMVKLGQKVVTVDSGAREMVPVVENKREPFNGGVKFATEINGEAQIFSMSSWYLLPTMKIFCVIFPDSSGIPQIRRIRLT